MKFRKSCTNAISACVSKLLLFPVEFYRDDIGALGHDAPNVINKGSRARCVVVQVLHCLSLELLSNLRRTDVLNQLHGQPWVRGGLVQQGEQLLPVPDKDGANRSAQSAAFEIRPVGRVLVYPTLRLFQALRKI
ncbi:MAG: hypothetical protein KGM44_03215 [bacterium]|nr:hypothetical protein [bacterium]